MEKSIILKCRNDKCYSNNVSVISYHKGVFKLRCNACEKTCINTIQIDPLKRAHPKIYNNDKCICGSGKKFKNCCRSSYVKKYEYEKSN